jgi:pentatricopeptide repeat protein
MIAGYVQIGKANESLALFNQMQPTDMKPDTVTIVNVLHACAHLSALQPGKCLHGYIIRSGYESDMFVGNSLIDMYAKCRSIVLVNLMFDKMIHRALISWNIVIVGFAMHGQGKDALSYFFRMQQSNIKPNHITFVCILYACSHAGMVEEGLQYFLLMNQKYYIKPKMEHYACMVDLLGHAGRLTKVEECIINMPIEPCASVCGALLGACRIHGNVELGERVAEHLFDLEPENTGYYVLLSNIYVASGRWDGVAKVRTKMRDGELKKDPGCILVEVNNKVHTFLMEDKSHPQS